VTPFKKILVPVDFSAHSKEAIKVAVDLSKRYDAELTLLHVYEPVALALPEGYVPYDPEQLTQILAAFHRQLLDAKQDALALGVRSVDIQQMQGVVESEIVDYATLGKFDLLVMGTHGRRGLQHMLLGSVTERVLRRAPCPVLTVRVPEG
jgi:nucleotide-binding universal stress UspA family protein